MLFLLDTYIKGRQKTVKRKSKGKINDKNIQKCEKAFKLKIRV